MDRLECPCYPVFNTYIHRHLERLYVEEEVLDKYNMFYATRMESPFRNEVYLCASNLVTATKRLLEFFFRLQ